MIAAAIFLSINVAFLVAAVRRIRSSRFAAERRAGMRFDVTVSAKVGGIDGHTADISLTGARLLVSGDTAGVLRDSRFRPVPPPPSLTDLTRDVRGAWCLARECAARALEGDEADLARATLEIWSFTKAPNTGSSEFEVHAALVYELAGWAFKLRHDMQSVIVNVHLASYDSATGAAHVPCVLAVRFGRNLYEEQRHDRTRPRVAIRQMVEHRSSILSLGRVASVQREPNQTRQAHRLALKFDTGMVRPPSRQRSQSTRRSRRR